MTMATKSKRKVYFFKSLLLIHSQFKDINSLSMGLWYDSDIRLFVMVEYL